MCTLGNLAKKQPDVMRPIYCPIYRCSSYTAAAAAAAKLLLILLKI